jgi:hypothetical protein
MSRQAPDDFAVAAALNYIGAVGRQLGSRGVNTICFKGCDVPESLLRRPLQCSLLDIAVGSGSAEMTKCLLEFHGAKATRETLKQSISTGNLELFKMVRERLPEAELRDRLELLELAGDFRQLEVVAWLCRNATTFECELFAVFAFEQKLADALVVVGECGLSPWWGGTRDVSLKWRASAKIELVKAPEGFSADGGWFGLCGNDEVPVRVPRGKANTGDPEAVDFNRKPRDVQDGA